MDGKRIAGGQQLLTVCPTEDKKVINLTYFYESKG